MTLAVDGERDRVAAGRELRRLHQQRRQRRIDAALP